MELDEIKALPVRSWVAKNAVLYLWTTVPHLDQALSVMPAWGFTYKSNFVWTKRERRLRHRVLVPESARAALDRRTRGQGLPEVPRDRAAGFGDRRAAAGVCAQARSRPRDHRAVSPRRAQARDVPARDCGRAGMPGGIRSGCSTGAPSRPAAGHRTAGQARWESAVTAMTTTMCATCGKVFHPKRPDARFCSGRCRVAAHRGGGNQPVESDVTDNPTPSASLGPDPRRPGNLLM